MKKGLPVILLLTITLISAAGCGNPFGLDSLKDLNPGSSDTSATATSSAAVLLELTYPAGESPKVFTTGWVFGARCLLNPGTDNEMDISDEVNWSGDAAFHPATGHLSCPDFKKTGENTITLEVKNGDETVRKQYTLVTVAPVNYARVGDIACCPEDAHGLKCCPHNVKGPILTGSPNVTVGGLPAARVGDTGVHGACCGSNTFEIVSGDPEVLIDGRPAARNGDATQHCGGVGMIISAYSGVSSATPTITSSSTPTTTKTVGAPVIIDIKGTVGLEDYGQQQVAVYIRGGKAPYHYEFGGTEIIYSDESGGTSCQITTKKNKFIEDNGTWYIWVTVKDANGQYATWADGGGNRQQKFLFGYKRNTTNTAWVTFTVPAALY